MITNYQRWLFELQRQESVETLREWVLKESEFQTVASEVKLGIVERPNDREHKSNQKSGSFFGRKQVQLCHFCHEKGHQIVNCKSFKALDIQKRWVKAKELKLCFRCLGIRHVGKLCSTNVPCGIEGCRSTHNRLLHDSDWVNSRTKDTVNTSNTSEEARNEYKQTTMSTTRKEYSFSSLRTIPVILKNGTRKIQVNALLDDASTQTYINEDVASELGVHGQRQTVSVNVLNSKQETFNSMAVEVGLESVDGSVNMNISALTTTKVTGMMKVIDWNKHANDWSHLRNIEFPKLSSRPIVDILIGMDYLELHCSLKDVCGHPGDPIARLTPLGWTCVGKADILTKGCKPETLGTKAWLQGPEFLKLDVSQWPKQIHAFQKVEMERKTGSNMKVTMMVQDVDQTWRLDPCRFSDWKRLCRVFAWVYRFLSNCRTKKDMRRKEELDLEEIEGAERKLISEDQKEAFPKEYWALYHDSRIPPKSKLIGLQPFLDETGVMRLNGRLRFAEVLSWEARFPIILPRKSPVTKLIVKHHHEMCHHMGTNTTLASLSSKFWIISSREEIREWENACSWCKKQKAKPAQQLMGNLPKVRVVCSMRAFVQAGVDFAGPFLTVQGRGKSRQKRYLCLFTCLATRAVHLEIAFGLDTNSFLNALFRMAHRRGMPKEIISDNGTNFVGAVKELKELVTSLDSDITKSKLANRGIVWRFNPPNAPHFGGVFESMVKSAKRAIYAVLSSSDVTDEELMTAFTGAEALLNSRPLTYQSAHTQDDVPLTPNHFLHGQLGGDFAPEIDSTSFSPQKRWRRIQELIRHIWRRWMREWLPTLNVRKKWVTSSRDFQVDDVVIVVSQDNPRGTWPMGRILKTYPGKDGHVRVVDVKVGGSRLTRPVTKICPLEYRD